MIFSFYGRTSKPCINRNEAGNTLVFHKHFKEINLTSFKGDQAEKKLKELLDLEIMDLHQCITFFKFYTESSDEEIRRAALTAIAADELLLFRYRKPSQPVFPETILLSQFTL